MAFGREYDEDGVEEMEGDGQEVVVATVAERGNDEYYTIPKNLTLIVDEKSNYKVVKDKKKNASAEVILKEITDADASFQTNLSLPLIGVTRNLGKEYCLVANSWARDLVNFLNGTNGGKNPGPVANEVLFDPAENLTKVRKLESSEYSIVSVPVWEVLMEHFGGGPEIKKKYLQGDHGAKGIAFGLDLRLICSKDTTTYRRMNFSKKMTVQHFKKVVAELFEVEIGKVRLYDYFQDKPYARLDGKNGSNQPIGQKNLMDDQLVLIECELEDGDYLIKRTTQSGGGATYNNIHSNEDSIKGGAPEIAGAVGLQNIGNTCYMNSTMQCLSNIPQLREFFVSEKYKDEINKDNPLSYDGKLAEAYGDIMQLLWSGDGNVVEPRGFKSVISDIKPEFAGYEQHDSQELLSYILDGLHEELNRIKNKPPTEKPVGNGRPDKDVAKESLDVYRLRNDSQISDLFTGLFKSTVTCPNPTCNNVSVTFDPYMILQLPLQAEEELYHKLHIIFVNPGPDYSKTNPPVQKFNVIAPKHGPVFLLRRIIANHKKVPANSVVLTQVSYSKITRKFADDSDLASISTSNSIVAFQVDNADKFLDSLVMPDLDWRRRLTFAPERYDEQVEDAEIASSDDEYSSPAELQSLDDDASQGKSGKVNGELRQETGFEAFDEEKIGYPNCPWVVGDVWQGKYQFEDTEQLLRVEVLEVEKIDDNNFGITAYFDTREDTFENMAKYKSHSAFTVGGVYTVKEKPAAHVNKKSSAKPKKKKSTMFGLRSKKTDSLKAPEEKFENAEAEFVGGTISFKPLEHRVQLYKGEPRSTYGRNPYSRYGGFGDDSQEEAREPIITIGSVDSLHKFMWGKVHNMQDFKRGEFFAQRLESRAWNTAASEQTMLKSKKTSKTKTEIGPVSPIPEVKPQDERIAVMIAHRRKSPYAHSSRYARTAFMVPHVALLHQNTTEAELYAYIEEQMKGWLDVCKDETPVEEVMEKVKIIRCTNKFETPSYAIRSREKLCVGEEIEKDSDDNMMADPSSFFLYLLIDWEEEKCPFERAIGSENLLVPNTSEVMNINSAVELFSKEEKLSPMNAWYCPKCKEFQEALKKLEIWSLPPVLVVQFKRFSQREGRNRADKLETQVDFPVKDLDLGEFVLSDNPLDRSKYDLVGVSSHVGALGLGHYTAVARNAENGSWYSYNDSRVSKLTERETEEIADPSAYVVFYLRKDLAPESFK